MANSEPRKNKLRLSAMLIVLGFVAATVFFAFFIPRIQTSGDTEAFLPKGHTSVARMRKIEGIFGSQDFLTVIVVAERSSIFTREALTLVGELTAAIERLPQVEEAISLSTISHLQGSEEGMQSAPLLPPEPYTAETIRAVKARLLSWDQYRRFLFSDDFRSTQIIIRPAGRSSGADAEPMLELVRGVKRITAEHELPGHRVLIAGEGVANLELLRGISRDLLLLVPGLLAVLIVILFFAFRSIRGVILPLVGVLVSNIWVIGIMALAGIPFTILGMVIPNLLMAVGSAYGIHMVNEQQEAFRSEPGQPSREAREAHAEAVRTAWKRVFVPIVLAALTTVGGFLSLVASPLVPMKHLGVFTAAGVVVSALCTLFLLPALLLLMGPGRARHRQGKTAILPRMLIRLYRGVGRSRIPAPPGLQRWARKSRRNPPWKPTGPRSGPPC